MLRKVSDFYNPGLWEKFMSFVGSKWIFASEYIKYDDTYHVIFSSKYKTIKSKCPKACNRTVWHSVTVVQLFYISGKSRGETDPRWCIF